MKKNKIISDDTEMYEKMITHIHCIEENKLKKMYDSDFIQFYEKGLLEIENKIIPIQDYNILKIREKDSKQEFYYLDSIHGEALNEKYQLLKIVAWKNTTCFYQFYTMYQSKIQNNTLKIDKSMQNFLENTIRNWDGHLHSKAPEMVV